MKRDMTRREREEYQALRSKLKERRMKSVQDSDGARWIIRKGTVINLTREKKGHRSGIPLRNMDQYHFSASGHDTPHRESGMVDVLF